jgi:hypothetical protein
MISTGITSSGVNTITVNANNSDVNYGGQADNFQTIQGADGRLDIFTGQITSTGSNSISVTSNNTSGAAHRTVQPTLIAECIVRVAP